MRDAVGPLTIVDEGSPNSTVSPTVTIPTSGWSYDPGFGLIVKGVILDHSAPITGADDPRFLQPDGRQIELLCSTCHQAKRARERRP